MKRIICLTAILLSLLAIPRLAFSAGGESPSPGTNDEEKIWNLERAYWRYVQENDLPAYRNLWHKDFLGWPWSSAKPLGKDRITDWITKQTTQGSKFELVEFKPEAIHVTGQIAVVYYRVTMKWIDKGGKAEPESLRITHSWLKTGSDWQIIGGMSAPQPGAPEK